jgi:uncharacterized protein DUF3226
MVRRARVDEGIAGAIRCQLILSRGGRPRRRGIHYAKATIHTYSALQDEPGKPLGQAITQESLRSSDSLTALAFITWLVLLRQLNLSS